MSEFIQAGPPRYDHQKRALLSILRTHGVCSLLMDPGTGKTAVTLDYAGLMAVKLAAQETRVLVVCPLAAIDTWVTQAQSYVTPMVNLWAEALGGSRLHKAETLAARGGSLFPRTLGKEPKDRVPFVFEYGEHPRALHHRESLAWYARRDGEVLEDPCGGPDSLGDKLPRLVLTVINIDTLTGRESIGSKTLADVMLDAVKRYNPQLLVVDESHKIKGVTGNASMLLGRIGKHVPRRLLLTGTVMPAGPLDVFAQWRTLDPYAFGYTKPDGTRKEATYGGFKSRYAVLGGWMGKEVVGYRDLDDMQSIMAKNSIVVRKKDALDLPPTTEVMIPVNLSRAEQKAYDDMKAKLRTQLMSGQFATSASRLTQMLRLRQITAGHLPADDGTVHRVGDSKAQTIRSLVHDSLVGERRIVVFAYFVEEIKQLTDVLSPQSGDRPTELQVITGATHTDERIRLRQRFGSDDPTRMVMIAQIRTMSLAVNELVTASHAIFSSLSQQRDDLVQARDRLDRIGQKLPVTYYYCNAPGTVDDVILAAHQQRGDLEAAVLAHIMGEENK